MRFKAVPPAPPSDVATAADPSEVVEAVSTVRDALPLVPRSEEDCCGRLVDRVGWIEDRNVATEWIVFLRALDLAEHSDAGYARRGSEIDPDAIARRFRTRILGAREVLDAIEETATPSTVEECFEAVEAVVPEWERRRSDAWREAWRQHTERLLAWATLLGLATERADGYVGA